MVRRTDLEQRAIFTRRRKEAYEALHPATRHGGDRRSEEVSSPQSADLKQDRFTLDTARKTGRSEATIQRDAERGEKVSSQAIAIIQGTKLDTGTYLDSIKELPAEQQVQKATVDLLLPKSVSPPKPTPTEADRKATQRQKFWDVWASSWTLLEFNVTGDFLQYKMQGKKCYVENHALNAHNARF